MKKFYVIGMDDNVRQSFSNEVMALIAVGKVFSGGKRHYDIVGSMLPPKARWIDITVPLDRVFFEYEECPEVIVFASGDPLFFGFATTIRNRIPDADIKVFPSFNSLQMLAHRLTLPYHDMRVVSLTGRPWHEFDKALIERAPKIGVLTDRNHTPSAIAARMLEYGYDNYVMHVGTHLGNPSLEKVESFDIVAASGKNADFPNCLILEAKKDITARPFGIPDEGFELLDGRTKMITKMPIRLLTLQMLNLREASHFWDVGFCTGSVSIEAKQQFPHLHIHSFEIREEGRRLIDINTRRFGTLGIEVHIGDFAETDISGLHQADAVFIGGYGGKLKEILRKIYSHLSKDGVIVFNSVSDESLEKFREAVASLGMRIDKEMSVSIDSFNRITICRASKQIMNQR